MRRLLATVALVGAIVTLVIVASAPGNDGTAGTYQIRAYFDNGGFIAKGEDVRVSGANVGSVESVDVSMPGEIDSLAGGHPQVIPGKAVVVMNITDPGFKDFRQDASCLIRPQSLIGEKYIDCVPTQGHAPGAKLPPFLTQIPDGQAGAGEYLLPLERNGKAVDLDLLQNIQRLPYRERFRLIINDLGAGLAGRGADLNEIVRKADPALAETDKVLKILADQNQELAQLAQNSDTVLTPLARERTHLSGFIRGAGQTAAATASQSAALETNLKQLPPTLDQLRSTFTQLGGFSSAASPFFSTLGAAAPQITTVTKLLGPFSDATTVSLKSLGNAADGSGPELRQSDPIVRKIRGLATAAQSPATNLAKLTRSLKKQKGFDSILKFVYNSAGTYNGFDRYGHYQRTNILVSSCIEYVAKFFPGCVANFTGPGTANAARNVDTTSRAAIVKRFLTQDTRGGGTSPLTFGDNGDTSGLDTNQAKTSASTPGADATAGSGPSSQSQSLQTGVGVLQYLLGP